MRRTLLSLITILLVVVVVLVGMQQWRSWRLDQSLGKASRAVAAASSAASDVGYHPDGDECRPKDPALDETWSKALANATLALAQLEAVHGPGSPHLHSLNRRIQSSLMVAAVSKETCELTVRKRHETIARNKRMARARVEQRAREAKRLREARAAVAAMAKARAERRVREAKRLREARAAVAAAIKAGSIVVFAPDPSASFCQGQQPAYRQYLDLENAAFKFVDNPPSAASQGEVVEWRKKLFQARSTGEDERDTCNDNLWKR